MNFGLNKMSKKAAPKAAALSSAFGADSDSSDEDATPQGVAAVNKQLRAAQEQKAKIAMASAAVLGTEVLDFDTAHDKIVEEREREKKVKEEVR